MSKPTTNKTTAVKPDATPRVVGKWVLPDNCVIVGLMSFPAKQLSSYGNSLNGRKLAIPSFGRMLRPQRVVSAHLLGLYAEACRLAETNDGTTGDPRISQGLE
jgi:hypothetical protein